MTSLTYIDGHVHLYECFSESAFFNTAADNFETEAAISGRGADVVGVMTMTETSRSRWFRGVRQRALRAGKVAVGEGWNLIPLPEDGNALLVSKPDRIPLIVVAGRQIITCEGLEVLAIGVDHEFSDGDDLPTVIESITSCGAIPVIPWAVGKWLGERGRIVTDYLRVCDSRLVLLGDNGGRLALAPRPAQFGLAETLGVKILPGSDPLPLTHEVARVGSFGARIHRALSRTTPAHHLRNLLPDRNCPFEPYGALQKLWPFVCRQTALRLKRTD